MSRSDTKTNDLASLQRDLSEQRPSGWHVLRGVYAEDVQRVVEAAGQLTLADLQRIELAEYLSMVELLASAEDPGDRLIERLESLKLQSRKQLARITEAMGTSIGVDMRQVPVPSWLSDSFVRTQAVVELVEERLGDRLEDSERELLRALRAACQMPGGDTGDELMS